MPDVHGAAALVARLLHGECYPHPVTRIEMLETHISWVLLTGKYAYKIKKPVRLAFLDFSTLEARRHYCEEELRLNRRYAPGLYLDVVTIGGPPDAPRIGGAGPALEYALRMREFPQDVLASRLLARGELTEAHIAALARRVADVHDSAQRARGTLPYGTPEAVAGNALDNFRQIEPLLESRSDLDALQALQQWTERELVRCKAAMHRRHADGMVRECHGDLHLGNIVLLEGELVPFDCIEFSEAFRWNDVMSEVAFVVMDLFDRKAPHLAWSFLNAYLEATGDYSGLAVLRFYLVYRAMVRAKVHLMRARQPETAVADAARLTAACREYVQLAGACANPGAKGLLLMHGFAGSGKSTVAHALARDLGAIRVRSDVERKRLQGLQALERSGSALGHGLYGRAATAATYAHLARIAGVILEAGHVAIIDAAFLAGAQRALLSEAARARGAPVAVVSVQAPAALLRSRIAARAEQGRDASEANAEVLTYQQTHAEPVTASEALHVFQVDGTRPLGPADLCHIRAWLAREQPGAANVPSSDSAQGSPRSLLKHPDST